MVDLALTRPDHLEDAHWEAISASHDRLTRSLGAEDRSQIIGCLKDLIESICKVVVVTRGEVVEPGAQFDSLVARAHRALERQPGEGLADAAPIRSIAQGAKSIAVQFSTLRNEFGTGHGRAFEPAIEEELWLVGLEAALLWSRWAVRRLGVLAFGLPEPLIHDLDRSTFNRGQLTARLRAANLSGLNDAIQRRVGVAVGNRAMRETFLVREEGVEACAAAGDLTQWPPSYRLGVLDGLFFNDREQLTLSRWMASIGPSIVTPLPDLERHIVELVDRVEASLGRREIDWTLQFEVSRTLRDHATVLPADCQAAWQRLADVVEPGAPF